MDNRRLFAVQISACASRKLRGESSASVTDVSEERRHYEGRYTKGKKIYYPENVPGLSQLYKSPPPPHLPTSNHITVAVCLR